MSRPPKQIATSVRWMCGGLKPAVATVTHGRTIHRCAEVGLDVKHSKQTQWHAGGTCQGVDKVLPCIRSGLGQWELTACQDDGLPEACQHDRQSASGVCHGVGACGAEQPWLTQLLCQQTIYLTEQETFGRHSVPCTTRKASYAALFSWSTLASWIHWKGPIRLRQRSDGASACMP